MNKSKTHPLTKGDIVNVKNSTLGGKEIIEGTATIVSPVTSREHTYNVRFHGDGHNMTYPRFVLPDQKLTPVYIRNAKGE